jgi:tRNA uridine 5-carbamoylmethylation protein Kti12
MSAVIGIGGMPGSGKSTFLKHFREDIPRLDDFNNNWTTNLASALAFLAADKTVIITDVQFCDPAWRRKLEEQLAHPVQWIVFENNPLKACANALKRNRRNNIANELRLIAELQFKHEPEPMKIITDDARTATKPVAV